ncbi:MAG TPA: hypothetical protein VFQ61_22080, partial [Polyangiaceae bacterium]|nr:hypothetical protein [Polyangiaceae bacterium]
MNDPIRIREPGSDASSELRELFRDAQRPQPLTPTIQADLASRVASIAATRGTLLTAVTAKAPIFLVGAALLGASMVALREPTPKTEPVAPVEPVSTGSS